MEVLPVANNYFEAITNDGKVQIDDNTSVYHFVSAEKIGKYFKYSSSNSFTDSVVSGGRHTGFFYQLTVGDNNDEDIYLIANPSDSPVCVWTNYACIRYTLGSPYRQYWYSWLRGLWVLVHDCTREQADNLIVYKFSKKIPTDGNCGLECYNKNGEKVFASYLYPLKILGFYQNIHTTSNKVVWTGDWNMMSPEYRFNVPIAVWMLQQAGGGTDGEELGEANITHFYLSKNFVKLAWLTSWGGEYDNIHDKYWYWQSIQNQYGGVSQYIVADVSNLPISS